uniref:hypothetical protein n=1 Tax=Nonomuraea sp. CA-252377 TaxID=3240003 RepID=UPI003F499607
MVRTRRTRRTWCAGCAATAPDVHTAPTKNAESCEQAVRRENTSLLTQMITDLEARLAEPAAG